MMNLMFWKKKPATEEGAESSQDNAALPDTTGMEPANQELSGTEAPVKPGLVARVKAKFAALTMRFKKSPAPKDEVEADQDKDTQHSAKEEAGDAAEPAEKPGLMERVRSGFTALVMRFKKSPAPKDETDQGKETQQHTKDGTEGAEEAAENAGLFARIKPALLVFVPRYKKHLIIALVSLLLIGIVFAAWDIIFPPLVRKPAISNAAKASQTHAPVPPVEAEQETDQQPQSEPPQAVAPQTEAEILKKQSDEAQARAEALKKQSEEAQAQAEALKKKSDEAQAQAEALKRKQEEERALAAALKKQKDEARAAALNQKQIGSPAGQAVKNGKPSSGSGEMIVENKDPKATATTLKEAIEAMNANSGGYTKKPDK